MPIDRVHSFLVHPAKNEAEQPDISGTIIPQEGSVYDMLRGVYARATDECHIEIAFSRNLQGAQQNDCRDLLIGYAADPSVPTGRSIASRLQSVSTHRSGLGLLFLIKGTEGHNHIVVIARFAADQGVIAEEHAHRLAVQFVDRVFMKNAKAYKSALYASDSFDHGFWDGHAVDRQITGPRETSDYWIRDFLISELRTTGPAGTKRFAVALREAITATEELGVRQELIAAAMLVRGQDGQVRSARQLIEQLGLSAGATAALESGFSRPDLMNEVFRFDREEFQRHAQYRSVELDNGGVMIAESARFADVFHEEAVQNNNGQLLRFTTEGRVVDERLRKTR